MSNSNWPPVDTHAHVDVTITPATSSRSVPSCLPPPAVSKNPDKHSTGSPSDILTVWGLGKITLA